MRGDVSKRPPASIACARSLGTPILCALPGSAQHRDPVPAVSSGHSETPIVGHVITDWRISDHMQSSKQDVTCDIIAYYV
ncbi:unnamed protein product [Staurois parvus]|uniref:Uncharacterized protein n=1 Tax=Staurois parvus TaxID=386267 RepID=A0ABN9E4P7_9NEOB|nr:unnamed protein product [Staurois parvus]